MKRKYVIDNETILNSYYDDRETFIVDYNPNLVAIELNTYSGKVIFRLKEGLKEK